MPAPEAVLELIERFDRNLDAYRSGRYNETPVRLEFIGPLSKALEWDIYNEQGHAEAYKDVVHEDAIKVGGAIPNQRIMSTLLSRRENEKSDKKR